MRVLFLPQRDLRKSPTRFFDQLKIHKSTAHQRYPKISNFKILRVLGVLLTVLFLPQRVLQKSSITFFYQFKIQKSTAHQRCQKIFNFKILRVPGVLFLPQRVLQKSLIHFFDQRKNQKSTTRRRYQKILKFEIFGYLWCAVDFWILSWSKNGIGLFVDLCGGGTELLGLLKKNFTGLEFFKIL